MKLTLKWMAVACLVMALQISNADAQQTRSRSSLARTTGTAVQLTDQADKYLIQEATPTQLRSVPAQVPHASPRGIDAPVPMSVYQAPTANVMPGEVAMPAPMMHPTGVYHHQDVPGVENLACDCGEPTCHRCRLRGRRASRGCNSCGTDCGSVACPRCEGDVCKLELDKSKVKKTCFKVEQVPVCIPPVRFPWQKCCPPGTSKTRLVTKLKTHKYECPNCAYKWTLQKPETEANSAAPTEAPTAEKATEENAKPKVDEEKVPRAPVLKGAFRTWGRRR